MQSILTETNNKLLTQTDLVTNLKQQILNYQSILNQKDQQFETQKELSNRLQFDLKKQKTKAKLFGGAGILLAVGAAVLVK